MELITGKIIVNFIIHFKTSNMKLIMISVLLLASLFFSEVTRAESPTVDELSGHYRSGKIKYNLFTYLDANGHIFKVVRETYRKNGSKRYNSIVMNGRISYFSKYTREGHLAMEKMYTYNFNGILVSIETKRNGIRSIQNFETDIFGNPLSNE